MCTGVEHLGYRRVVHHGQRLTFGLKALKQRAVVHPRSDELQRNLTAQWRRLLGKPDVPHTAFSQRLEQPVRSN
jgi:hypothetical protein